MSQKRTFNGVTNEVNEILHLHSVGNGVVKGVIYSDKIPEYKDAGGVDVSSNYAFKTVMPYAVLTRDSQWRVDQIY